MMMMMRAYRRDLLLERLMLMLMLPPLPLSVSSHSLLQFARTGEWQLPNHFPAVQTLCGTAPLPPGMLRSPSSRPRLRPGPR